jgi:hypothetical protein
LFDDVQHPVNHGCDPLTSDVGYLLLKPVLLDEKYGHPGNKSDSYRRDSQPNQQHTLDEDLERVGFQRPLLL